MGRMERERESEKGAPVEEQSRCDEMDWVTRGGRGGTGSMSVTVPVKKEEGVRGGWRCDRND